MNMHSIVVVVVAPARPNRGEIGDIPVPRTGLTHTGDVLLKLPIVRGVDGRKYLGSDVPIFAPNVGPTFGSQIELKWRVFRMSLQKPLGCSERGLVRERLIQLFDEVKGSLGIEWITAHRFKLQTRESDKC